MKLIRYIVIRYSLYTILLALLLVPLFYLLVQHIMIDNLDEALIFEKNWINKKLQTGSLKDFTSYNNSTTITPATAQPARDSFYSKNIFIPDDQEWVKHRILEAVLHINGQYYHVQIEKSMLEGEDLVKSTLLLQLGFIFFLLIGVFMINRKLSKNIFHPFKDTLNKLSLYRVDNHRVPEFTDTRIIEFQQLNRSLELLLHRNATLYKAQKEFTENASHELQTPLAVIQSKLDLLLQTPVSREQAGLIEELTNGIRKLQKLNRSLLLLTKIENNQFPETEQILLARIIEYNKEQFSGRMKEKKLRLIVQDITTVAVKANSSLIEILVSNLFSNALRHTPHGGTITVSLFNNELSISNTAAGAALDPACIFHRFNKQSADSKSMGLGLQICKKIAELYDYQLNYTFKDGQHCFTVLFS
ncbi:two-component sensor histidine kinase [Niabella ginsenosidivorans]|uniref:histidine kinase n=1 Tax=Niabella ginsenosidivorans TaxID=1176587 RepID=A0A1A9I7M1_9BACT|nr:HAMP domain-containing sensor histidine kinase [Niabella ginsenosidivorans]ANH82652.1 two-component sensor histidine kinase [Niabella ginsenosidivorans]